MFKQTQLMIALAAGLIAGASTAQTTTDFDGLNLPASGFVNGGPVTSTTLYNVDGVVFNNSFTDTGTFTFWSGFSFSNVNDTSTPGFGNQYAAYTGTDVSGDGNYAVAFPTAFIDLPLGQSIGSIRVTNTTYAALSMLNGDTFAKQFGGVTGDDPDFFDVIFTGYTGSGASGSETGTVSFRLADYTFTDNSNDYIVDTWELVDLTGLGDANSIGISFASSDAGSFGINTPTYVALDNLVIVPEPSSLAILALSGIATTRRRR